MDKQQTLEFAYLNLIWTSDRKKEFFSLLKPGWIMTPPGKRVYEITSKLFSEGNNPDSVMAASILDYSDFDNLLLSWQHDSPSEINYRSYLSFLAENYTRNLVQRIIKENPDELDLTRYDRIKQAVIDNLETTIQCPKFSDVAFDIFNDLKKETPPTAIKSGLQVLDESIWGFRPHELYTFGGRPGEGKTSLVCQLALTAARAGHSVLLVTTEMGSWDIVLGRLLSMETHIPAWKFRTYQVKKADELIKSYDKIKKYKIFLFDSPMPTLGDISHAINKTKPDLVIVDYLQRCRPPVSESRRVEVMRLVIGFKTMAKENHLPVILAAQLNRETDRRRGMPLLADLMESGSIEAESDVVVLLWETPPTDPKGMREYLSSNEKNIRARIAKNRHGPLNIFDLVLDKKTMSVRATTRPLSNGIEDNSLENVEA